MLMPMLLWLLVMNADVDASDCWYLRMMNANVDAGICVISWMMNANVDASGICSMSSEYLELRKHKSKTIPTSHQSQLDKDNSIPSSPSLDILTFARAVSPYQVSRLRCVSIVDCLQWAVSFRISTLNLNRPRCSS